jgi:hypothetical protein
MSLSPVELDYQAIQSASVVISDTDDRSTPILDEYSHSSWIISMASPDPFDDTFPTNESIMEIMSLEETPWDDSHHRSSFFPKLENIESHVEPPEILNNSQTPTFNMMFYPREFGKYISYYANRYLSKTWNCGKHSYRCLLFS